MLGPVPIAVAPAAPPPPSPTLALLAVLAALRLILILCRRRPSAFRLGGPTVLLLLALALLLPPWLVPMTLVAFLVGSLTTPMPLLLSGIGIAVSNARSSVSGELGAGVRVGLADTANLANPTSAEGLRSAGRFAVVPQLLFTPADWFTPQAVTVMAIEPTSRKSTPSGCRKSLSTGGSSSWLITMPALHAPPAVCPQLLSVLSRHVLVVGSQNHC